MLGNEGIQYNVFVRLITMGINILRLGVMVGPCVPHDFTPDGCTMYVFERNYL